MTRSDDTSSVEQDGVIYRRTDRYLMVHTLRRYGPHPVSGNLFVGPDGEEMVPWSDGRLRAKNDWHMGRLRNADE